MIIEKHLEKTEETLLLLEDSLPQANVDRFLYGLKLHAWDETAIMGFTVEMT
jgi:hypothetical protein